MTSKDRMIVFGVAAVCLLIGFLLVPVVTGAGESALPADLPSYGAPPMVPHQDYPAERCIQCHGGSHSGDNAAVALSAHPERKLCRQCHMHRSEAELRVPTTFKGE